MQKRAQRQICTPKLVATISCPNRLEIIASFMVCILQGTKRSLGHWKIYWLFSRSLIFKWSSWPQEHFYYMVMVRAQCLGFFQGALFISTLLSINSLILNKSLKSKDMYGNHRCGLACITYRGSRIPGDGLFNRRLEEDKDNSSWAMDPTFLDTFTSFYSHG